MTFELVVMGLCALTLYPCPKMVPKQDPIKLYALFPSVKNDRPQHYTELWVKKDNCNGCVGREGEDENHTRFLIWDIEGELTITSNGYPLKLNSTMDDSIIPMKTAVKKKPWLGWFDRGLPPDIDGTPPTPDWDLVRASLVFDVDGSSTVSLKPMTYNVCKHIFYGDAAFRTVATEAKGTWTLNDNDDLEIKLPDGTTLDLEPDGSKNVAVMIRNLPRSGVSHTMNLKHFRFYYDLSSQTLDPGERYFDIKGVDCGPLPKGHPQETMTGGPEQSKLVACAICQGCGG